MFVERRRVAKRKNANGRARLRPIETPNDRRREWRNLLFLSIYVTDPKRFRQHRSEHSRTFVKHTSFPPTSRRIKRTDQSREALENSVFCLRSPKERYARSSRISAPRYATHAERWATMLMHAWMLFLARKCGQRVRNEVRKEIDAKVPAMFTVILAR